jgi:NAD(P)-dependent dehydrogenase (short-subunit alcohol dehydrogenase family)
MQKVKDSFDLTTRVAVITGGAGLLGRKHAEAIGEMGGHAVLWDIDGSRATAVADEISTIYGTKALGLKCDITDPHSVSEVMAKTLETFGQLDILINNAARNPKVEGGTEGKQWSRFENLSLATWRDDVEVGLTGAFLCSQAVGTHMALKGKGVILNIASDLAIIAPDQRIYSRAGLTDDQQPVKPVTYSVVKTGLLGLTRYLATYWAERGVRVNSISMGGVYDSQEADFVGRLSKLIPLGRMAHKDEYKAAIIFLVSDASSYMTGANLVMDGGRSCW